MHKESYTEENNQLYIESKNIHRTSKAAVQESTWEVGVPDGGAQVSAGPTSTLTMIKFLTGRTVHNITMRQFCRYNK
jgi:hypothetical protein